LKNARERLVNLDTVLENERASLERCETQKVGVQQEIKVFEETIAGLREELGEIQETLEEKNKAVEQVKKTTLKASKVLDLALKEIANCVCGFSLFTVGEYWIDEFFLQNDVIEKLALERSSLYRKCRLEEIKLPLLQGNLRNVPIEEVSVVFRLFCYLCFD